MTIPTASIQVWSEYRKNKLRDLIGQLYRVVAALKQEFEGRRFNPDGHPSAKWSPPMHSTSHHFRRRMQPMTRRRPMARLCR